MRRWFFIWILLVCSSSSQAKSSDYALAFFFRSDCAYCHQFAPIMQSMSKNTGLFTYAFSVDGKGMRYYPTPLMATPEIIKTFYGYQQVLVPSVFVVHVHTRQFVRVSAGYLSYAELEKQLSLVFKSPQIMYALAQGQ